MDWGRSVRAVLAVVLISTAGCSAITDLVGPTLDESDRAAAIDLAEQTASEIEQWRDDRITTARRLTDAAALRSGDPARANDYLLEEARVSPDIFQIHLVNLDNGTIIASSDREYVRTPLNTREAPWQRDDIEYGDDEVFVSPALEAYTTSLVSFVSPVETGTGDAVAVVVQTSVDTVLGEIPKPSEAVSVQLVDSQYRIVGDSEAGDLERNDGVLPEYADEGWNETAIERGLDGDTGVISEEVGGQTDEEYATAYAPVEGVDWVVTVHVPTTYEFPTG